MNVLVTGGSRGLGLVLCRDLLERGHRVGTFSRTTTREVAELEALHGDRFSHRVLDATDDEAASAFLTDLVRDWGRVDALVLNAAVGQDSLLAHTSPAQIARLLDVNVRAPIVLTRSFGRQVLRRGGGGRVVVVGSIGARQGYPGLTVYAATKGALESFARALAAEMKGRLLVNVVAPGFFESEMSSALAGEQLGSILRRTPTGSLTTPEQVSEVVTWLLTADTNVNGSVITVDGGASA
ncbi:SDR family NAD(P)-dependent oxidoreductase [Kineococcus sp. SYSU DK018]|uniref:SDR family NAD(P)-dependent oxidoreductase n=1 Tax=Kineococcus sp. SYSU DK018 TaxID=3383139 RepID=UPI003D7DD7E8